MMSVGEVANNFRLYVLADKLQSLKTLPNIMDSIRSDRLSRVREFTPKEIEYVYNNTL